MIAALISIIVVQAMLCSWLFWNVHWAFGKTEDALVDTLIMAEELLRAKREILELKDEKLAWLRSAPRADREGA